jgi:dTDP-N-acetylfucosamine:lipid II N-acetylfucosaminyltransferase
MNYHICIQDKFLSSYIEDIYLLNEQENNKFWFRGKKGDSPFFETNRPIEYIGNNKEEVIKRLKQLNKEDKIFVHWFDIWIGELLMDVPNKLFVYHWGGEFFTTPFGIQMKWLFDKKTLDYVKDSKYLKLKWRYNIFEMYRQSKFISNFYLKAKNEFEIRNIQVGRIDYILMTEGHDSDISKTKELFPNFKAKYLFSFYDSNFSKAIKIEKKKTNKGFIKILLGNSSDPTNNHLDAFFHLKGIKNIKIYCPLSYGDEKYRDFIIKKGKIMFGDNFIPITEFMTRETYIEFLNEMDIIYMFHNRSQAWGNILTSLTLGKPIFLKKNNSLFSSILKLELPVFDVSDSGLVHFENAINKMNLIQDSISSILQSHYSENVRLTNLKNVLNYKILNG